MKTAIITGASRGIGRALAIELGTHGYRLALCSSRSEAQLLDTKEYIRSVNPEAEIYTELVDVSSFEAVRSFVANVKQQFNSIDVLINNAGISMVGLLQDMTPEEWSRIVNVNLSSAFYLSKCVIPDMVAQQSGKILNISSVWGLVGGSCEVAYSTTKGGINAFTKALGKELAPSNIAVNAIACGFIDTDMNHIFSEADRAALMDEIPAGRAGTPGEVASFARALLESSSYITGEIIKMDGGWI